MQAGCRVELSGSMRQFGFTFRSTLSPDFSISFSTIQSYLLHSVSVALRRMTLTTLNKPVSVQIQLHSLRFCRWQYGPNADCADIYISSNATNP